MTPDQAKHARGMRAMSADVVAVVDAAGELVNLINVALDSPNRNNIAAATWHWPTLTQLRTLLFAVTDPVAGPRAVAANEIEGCTQMLVAAGLEQAAPTERTTTP